VLAANQTDGPEEDAKRDREHGALAKECPRTAGHGDGGEGHEVPGGQLHTRGISGRGRRLLGRFTCRRSYDTQRTRAKLLQMSRRVAQAETDQPSSHDPFQASPVGGTVAARRVNIGAKMRAPSPGRGGVSGGSASERAAPPVGGGTRDLCRPGRAAVAGAGVRGAGRKSRNLWRERRGSIVQGWPLPGPDHAAAKSGTFGRGRLGVRQRRLPRVHSCSRAAAARRSRSIPGRTFPPPT
jgi:hypothetical protein